MEIQQIKYVVGEINSTTRTIERLCLYITHSPDQESTHTAILRDELKVNLAILAEQFKILEKLI